MLKTRIMFREMNAGFVLVTRDCKICKDKSHWEIILEDESIPRVRGYWVELIARIYLCDKHYHTQKWKCIERKLENYRME